MTVKIHIDFPKRYFKVEMKDHYFNTDLPFFRRVAIALGFIFRSAMDLKGVTVVVDGNFEILD